MAQIRFRNPTLSQMANGFRCILLTEDGSWESFAAFAEAFAVHFGASIAKRIDGPDVRLWTLDWQGNRFHLAYDDYNGVSLEPVDAAAHDALLGLFEKLKAESSPEGL